MKYFQAALPHLHIEREMYLFFLQLTVERLIRNRELFWKMDGALLLYPQRKHQVSYASDFRYNVCYMISLFCAH